MHYLEDASDALAENLALDEALLIWCEGRPERSAFRIWTQPSASVVLGASGRLHYDVDVDACSADGIAIGRRCSGGGTVLIGPSAVNVTVILPIVSDPALAFVEPAQSSVLERLAGPVRKRGVPIVIQGSGDWTLANRKVAGSAQRRLKTHVMVHASILLDHPLDAIQRYLREPKRQPAYRAGRAHADFLTNIPLPRADLTAALTESMRPATGWLGRVAIDAGVVANLIATKYGDPSWIARF